MTSYHIDLPLDGYDYSLFSKDCSDKTIARIEKLILEALGRMRKPLEFELYGKAYNYGVGPYEIGSHYGLNCHQKEGIWIVFATQRDIAYPHAIFSLSDWSAASKYFVWQVSKGEVEINWELFTDPH